MKLFRPLEDAPEVRKVTLCLLHIFKRPKAAFSSGSTHGKRNYCFLPVTSLSASIFSVCSYL